MSEEQLVVDESAIITSGRFLRLQEKAATARSSKDNLKKKPLIKSQLFVPRGSHTHAKN